MGKSGSDEMLKKKGMTQNDQVNTEYFDIYDCYSNLIFLEET